MKKKHKKSYNHSNSKVGEACRNCNRTSTTDFAKNKSAITDNEYEVNSESNCTNKKKRSK